MEPVQVLPASLSAKHEERIVERVAFRSGARENDNAQDALRRHAGPRVHDVRIDRAAGRERFLRAPGD
jgi:hypothetical protein